LFELKYDGFRSLAVIHDGRCELISRNGHPFSFDSLRKNLTVPCSGRTVLDGEIACVDKCGKPQFNDLLFHRGEPLFFALDVLMADGKDLRMERLTDRKQELQRLLSKNESQLQYVDHLHEHGTALFQRVCQDGFGRDRGEAQLRAVRHRVPAHHMVQDQESKLFPDGGP
jgi:bifunctional non-homologous end joining protein LigD